MTSAHEPNPAGQSGKESVQLPSPTLWPPLLALGIALAATGLVTNNIVAAIGGVLALAGGVGWFLQVLPHEHHETVPVTAEPGHNRRLDEKGRAHRRFSRSAAASRAPAARDLPHFGGDQRRFGGRRRDGAAGGAVRRGQSSQHLVSDQSPRRGHLRADAGEHGADGGFPHRIVGRGDDLASHHVDFSRAALRRALADAAAPADCASAAFSPRSCGPACSTTFSISSIPHLISASTGDGSSLRKSLSESSSAWWSCGRCASRRGSSRSP